MSNRTLLSMIAASAAASAAIAQPKFVALPFSGDLSGNGNTAVGWLYDGALAKHVPMKWARGAGFTRLPRYAPGGGSSIQVSADGTVFAAGLDNTSNWGDLNCFTGYNSNGTPRVQQSPCSYPSIAHRYTTASGWVSAGSLARTVDVATGRWIGGTRCDSTINTVGDLSGDGRYIVGGAYSANATNPSGTATLGLCGDYFAYRFDSLNGTFEKLPTSSKTTRADAVSADGSVVGGYDNNAATSLRRLAVWSGGTETILDADGYNAVAVAADGNSVASGASFTFSNTNYGLFAMALVKWNRSGNTWTPQNLGVPADWTDDGENFSECTGLMVRAMNADGSTIVGDAYYGGEAGRLIGMRRPFIWRANLNGGVPMDLLTYVGTLDPNGTALSGMSITMVTGLSADGNTLAVLAANTQEFCTPPNQTLQTTLAGVLSLNGNVGNEVPSIAVQPVNASTRCTWPGLGAVMNVIAGGSWPLSYQWQRQDPSNPGQWIDLQNSCSGTATSGFPMDGSWAYEGTRGPQIRMNVVDADGSKDGLYRCVVSNAYGSVVSEAAMLSFESPLNPLNPQDTFGCSANPAEFTVGTVPGGVTFRWQICTSPENDTWANLGDGPNYLSIGNIVVTGATTSTVSIDPGTLAAGSQHMVRCHLADSCNLLDSNPATMTVISSCGPADLGGQGGIPAVCGDHLLDNNDFVVFIDFFFNANPRADVGRQGGLPGGDGIFDNNDFVIFIDYFFNGCN